MNNLSWFLYFAEILPNVGSFFLNLGALTCVCWCLFHIFTFEHDRPLYYITVEKKFFLKPLIAGVVAIVVFSLIPSKETIYLILGSEAGETIVTSAEGEEILRDIKTVIKQQIKTPLD